MGLICSGHHCFLKVIAAAARTPPGAWVPAAAARTSPPSGESCGEKRGLLLNLNAVCRLQRPRPEGSRGPARLGTFSRHGWLSSGGGSLGCARRRLLTLGDKVAGDLPPPGQVGAFPRDRCCGALWPKAPRWAGPRWAVRRRVGDTWRGCLRVHLCWRVQCQVTGSPRGALPPLGSQPRCCLPPATWPLEDAGACFSWSPLTRIPEVAGWDHGAGTSLRLWMRSVALLSGRRSQPHLLVCGMRPPRLARMGHSASPRCS